MFRTSEASNRQVVKRAILTRENKDSAGAPSPPPPIYPRNGESGGWAVNGCRAASAMWTKGYVDAITDQWAATFTTSALALLKGPRTSKPFACQELRPH